MQRYFQPEYENVTTIEELSKSFTKQTGFDYTNHIKPTLIQHSTNDTIPFIQNKDFHGIHVNFNTDYYIPEAVADKFPRILLDERCLLISISGSIGNVGVFNNMQKAFIGGAIAIAKFKDKNLLDWVMYYLISEEGQNKLLNNVKAGSHQNLILDDIRKIRIPLPPQEQRDSITNALNVVDKELGILERKRQKLSNIKVGMMQELLTGKTRLV